jgi:hypothetical protein
MVIVANYAFESSFMTPHLEGEEVFGSTKCNVDFFLRVDDKLHRLDHINFLVFVWPFSLVNQIVTTIKPIPIPLDIPPNIDWERPHSTHVDFQWKS